MFNHGITYAVYILPCYPNHYKINSVQRTVQGQSINHGKTVE